MFDRQKPPPVAAIFFGTVTVATAVAARCTDFEPAVWTAVVTTLVAVLGLLAIRTDFGLRRHALVVAGSLVLAHGALVVADVDRPSDHPLVSWLDEDRRTAEIEGEIAGGPIFHDRGVSVDLELTSVDIDEEGRLSDPPPRIRLFVPTDHLPPCSRLPLPGDEITVWAELRRFAPAESPWRISQRRLLEGRGYTAAATAAGPVVFRDDTPTSLFRRLERRLTEHRVRLEYRLADHLEGPALALATAMLTGSRGRLTPELREPFDITSTGHILAISGLHFAVVAGLVALVIRLLLDRIPRLYRWWPRRMLIGIATLVVLALYLLAIGAPISARRAFGMTALAIAVVSFSPWRIAPLSALATTAGVLLLTRPTLVVEAGFQLSVCASAGILTFLRYRPALLRPPDLPGLNEESRPRRWLRKFGTFVGISVSATLATWPVLLAMNGELPVAGLGANLVVVPLVGSVLFPLLVAGALLTGIWEWAAEWLLTAATEGLLGLHTVLEVLAYVPGAVIRWGAPTDPELIGLSAAVVLVVLGGYRLRALVLAAVVAGLSLLPGAVSSHLSPDTVRMHFIDVGQGDATLLEAPDGTTILVDGGGRPVGRDPGLTRVVPYLRHRGIDRLDAVVLTHQNFDHYGGLFATIRPFAPRRLVVPSDVTEERVQQLCSEMRQNGTAVSPVSDRAVLSTDEIDFRFRSPDLDEANANDRSLVVHFRWNNARIVLPGDLEARGEARLVEAVDGPAALVKTPHHGSATSSTPRFVDHFSPAATVVSAGRNHHFDHPAPEVLDRYRRAGVDVFRTDRHGSIIATVDDQGHLRIRTTRGGVGPDHR